MSAKQKHNAQYAQ